MNPKLILASASPRRKQLLSDIGLRFEVKAADIEEKNTDNLSAIAYAKRLCAEKAEAVAAALSEKKNVRSPTYILAADTIVVLKSEILEKPKDSKHALRMLQKLSGRSHAVYTAWTWLGVGEKRTIRRTFILKTEVKFSAMPTLFWKDYIRTGEPLDKAGAYAAQGGGLSFIESVRGSYSNVIGLPLPQVLSSFKLVFRKDLLELFQRHR